MKDFGTTHTRNIALLTAAALAEFSGGYGNIPTSPTNIKAKGSGTLRKKRRLMSKWSRVHTCR